MEAKKEKTRENQILPTLWRTHRFMKQPIFSHFNIMQPSTKIWSQIANEWRKINRVDHHHHQAWKDRKHVIENNGIKNK